MSCAESQQFDNVTLYLLIVFRGEENPLMADKPEQKELYRAYLSMAVFCEKVLREADGVMSIIRIIDRFNVPGTTPEMNPTGLNFTLLILFRAGFLRGKQTVSVRPNSPDGEAMPSWNFPVVFEGDSDRGNGVGVQLNFTVTKEGLYWFDVYLNDELQTRMPLTVVYQQNAYPTAGA